MVAILAQPIVTILALILLIFFIVTLSDLLNMDRSKFTDKELLFTLVPTVALLFGSIYNYDFFFKDFHFLKDGKDESKKSKESEESKECEEPEEATPLLRNTPHVLEESV